ncbi:MAG: hypothetical protein ABUS57_13500 [Pseudomonadota bacterium]
MGHATQFAMLAVLPVALGACNGAPQGATTATQTTAPAPQAATPASTEAPPTENGVYVAHVLCPGEGGCPWRHWRAAAAIELHAQPDANAPVIATLASGDWVDALDGQVRLVPRRGVVRTADQQLAVGDVVYLLEPQGEGDFSLWRRGELLTWSWPDGENPIEWAPDAPDAPTLGWFVHVKTTDGKDGWVREPRDFECMGPLAGDTGCEGEGSGQ